MQTRAPCGFNPFGQPAIVKADRDPAIIVALDNLADLTLQRHLGSPLEEFERSI